MDKQSNYSQEEHSTITNSENLNKKSEFGFLVILKMYLPTIVAILIVVMMIIFSQIIFSNDSNAIPESLNNITLPDFNFAAVGDWGCTQMTDNTVKSIVYKNPELVLGLGDYSYRDKADCWISLVNPLDEKMKIAIGNHDYKVYINETSTYTSASLLKEYLDHFNLTRQYYSFDYQNIHFVVISTENPYERGSEQYKFVRDNLKSAASNASIDWIVVFYHRLAYTSPGVLQSLSEFRNTYHPLFEKYDVDLVLQGHSHNYQRTFPITYNSKLSSEPFVTDRENNNYLNPEGQIFATVGTGGATDVHNFTAPPSNFTAVQFNAFGFLNIEVLHNGTILEGNFYENNGTIKDHFKIFKVR